MRLLVTGGRNFNDAQTLRRILGSLDPQPTYLAQGGARGADMLAKHWAEDTGVYVDTFPANWEKHGRAAGPIRNEEMLQVVKPDAVLAFPGNVGTKHMISIAERDGVPTFETCFVFGSNLAGRHGKGAALNAAEYWQAKYGVGCGPTGWSYAIPTKQNGMPHRSDTLGLDEISRQIRIFIDYADEHPKTIFFVTAIGCGLAGYLVEDIAPCFVAAPTNCILPMEFGASSPSLVEVRSQTAVSAGSNPASRTS